jgi:hypothetical protein
MQWASLNNKFCEDLIAELPSSPSGVTDGKVAVQMGSGDAVSLPSFSEASSGSQQGDPIKFLYLFNTIKAYTKHIARSQYCEGRMI